MSTLNDLGAAIEFTAKFLECDAGPATRSEAAKGLRLVFSKYVAALATQQADVGERGDEDAEEEEEEREPLDSEWEEVVLDLAQKHHLGRRIRQIATMRDQAPDVFYTDASYRTHELFSFAEELMQIAREPLVKSTSDMTWAMAIIREITRTQQAETFEETVEAVRALATQQPEALAQQERDREDAPCPDGLLPDGEICPRCGGKRGPSGIDGGSWVHIRAARSSEGGSPYPSMVGREGDGNG